MSDKSAQLEALLYSYGGEMKRGDISEALNISDGELDEVASKLTEVLKSRGLTLVETGKTLSLRTASSHSKLIADVHKKELEKDLGDAGLEVLAIVLYKGVATKLAIDHIRGVNSATTLRNLAIRGLLERSRHEKDARQIEFTPSADLLAHLGVAKVSDLPEYEKVKAQLKHFEESTSKETYGADKE